MNLNGNYSLFNKESFNQLIKRLEISANKEFKERKLKERKLAKERKDFYKEIEEKHKSGSVIIGNRQYMSFKEYEDYIRSCFSQDHLIMVEALFPGWIHGRELSNILINSYKDYIGRLYKFRIDEFQ